jgi:transcriptional regulator NrdR family protein
MNSSVSIRCPECGHHTDRKLDSRLKDGEGVLVLSIKCKHHEKCGFTDKRIFTGEDFNDR